MKGLAWGPLSKIFPSNPPFRVQLRQHFFQKVFSGFLQTIWTGDLPRVPTAPCIFLPKSVQLSRDGYLYVKSLAWEPSEQSLSSSSHPSLSLGPSRS